MATTGKTFANLPLSTINPEKTGAQGTSVFDTLHRPLQWLTPPSDEGMQQPENDASLWTFLDQLPSQGNPWTNPTIWWKIENRLNQFTSLNRAAAALDTRINVVEVGVVKPGYLGFLPQTNQMVAVTAVDPSYAEGWTNIAGNPCNVTISRTNIPGPTLAAANGAEFRTGVPLMGEFGEPKEGITSSPGDPMYNLIQLFGVYIKMSRMQKESLMAGDYGTHMQLIADNEALLKQQLQTTLLMGKRGSFEDADEGMVYLTNGIIPQIQDNVLTATKVGNSLTFQALSEFIDGTFESANSGSTKKVLCGSRLFMNMLNTARQEGKLTSEPAYNPSIGVSEYRITTGGGKTVTVMEMRFAFQGSLADWGVVLDDTNVAIAEYAGFGWKWMMDLEAPMQGITTQTDALVGSISVTIRDPDTCGVIKGGTQPILADRNGLGIVTQF
jgi:hypothetical protein